MFQCDTDLWSPLDRNPFRTGKHPCTSHSDHTLFPAPMERDQLPFFVHFVPLMFLIPTIIRRPPVYGILPDRRTGTARRAGLSGTMPLMSKSSGPYLII